jgi:cytochrome c-type biogenesis protein
MEELMRKMNAHLRLPALLLVGTLLLAALRFFMPSLTDVALLLYSWANSVYGALAEPINNLRLGIGVPAVGAFLLGLLAATAPCQLSTNAAAIAYFAKDATEGRAWRRALLFLSGKAAVYLILAGVAVWMVGGTFSAPGVFFVGVRRVLGPVMILLGLAMLGYLRLRLSLRTRAASRLLCWAETRGGALGDFSLGSAFGLAFCSTLFWLFFGLMLPSAVASNTGVLFPALFALGTGVPLLLMLVLLGQLASKREVMGGMRRVNRTLSVIAGVVLLFAGVYDTIVYWLM